MTQLVTKEEAMNFLRYDEEPPELDFLINAASAAVLNYLGDDASFLEVESDSEDYAAIPPEVKAATLIWMGEMDQNREGAQPAPVDPKFGYGYPPAAVVGLLSPLRCPRMA
jgi:hypothetical protein